MHHRLLREFSRRTVEALRAALPVRLALPALESFLDENVAKEARKDALVIRRAAQALAAGAPPNAETARSLLAAARAVDREFLARVGAFPVRIKIRYEAIEPLRLRRVQIGLELAYRILAAWQAGRRRRDAFAPGELEGQLREMLRLYADETQALSGSVRLPALLAPLRDRLARRLREAMLGAVSSMLGAAPAAARNG